MKAWIYDRFGPVDGMHLAEVAAPLAKAGEVLVRVQAVAVNVIDGRIRQGAMKLLAGSKFPKIPGADVAGVVERVGAGVDAFKPGDRVFGGPDPMKGGACAEFAAIPAKQLAAMPDGLSFAQAASLPVCGLAGLYSVRELGQLKPGGRVLVHGASGGLGLSALQLAKILGGHVTAVVGTRAVPLVKELGADVVIDYRTQTAPLTGPFDLIVNASGKMAFAQGRRLLSRQGRLVEPSPDIAMVIGSALRNLLRAQKHLTLITVPKTADLAYLAGLVGEGRFRTVIAKTYPFADAKDAFAEMEKGGAIGKLMIDF